jgi:integrase
MKLKDIEIKKAKPKEKKYKMYDGDYLYLLVTPKGKKLWYYKPNNKKEFSLGEYPYVSLKDARNKKAQLKREIEIKGLDTVIKELNEQKTKEKRKFELIVNEWLQDYKRGKAERTYTTTLQRVNKHIIPAFKNKDIRDITLKDVYNLLKKHNKATAEKLKSILNGIFSFAITKEYIKYSIISNVRLSDIFTATPKEHYPFTVDEREIKIYYDEVKDITPLPITKGAIKIIWLTALRQGTVRKIKWEHIDYENKTLHVPKENLKIKTIDLTVPLTDEAIKTFRELEKYRASDYVFYSPVNRKNPISETSLRNHQRKIKEKHGITYQSLHGIRHTFGTLTRKYEDIHGVKDIVIELGLQHNDKEVMRANYNHHKYLEKLRRLLNWWESFLNS